MTQRHGPIINPLATLGTYGLGPLSGLMLFVISAPIIITGAPTLVTKVVGVAIGFLTSAALSAVSVLAERGETLAAIALGGAALLTLVAIFGQQGRMAKSRAMATQRLVTETVQVVSGVTRRVRGGRTAASGAAQNADTDQTSARREGPDRRELTDPTSAFHMSAFIDQLVMGLIWQAAAQKDPRIFRDQMLEGLEEIRDNFADNTVTDPQGSATKVAGLYLASLKRHFASTRIDPTWSEIRGRTAISSPRRRATNGTA
jgi:hypothetical protein